jgi:hypothetical protein
MENTTDFFDFGYTREKKHKTSNGRSMYKRWVKFVSPDGVKYDSIVDAMRATKESAEVIAFEEKGWRRVSC